MMHTSHRAVRLRPFEGADYVGSHPHLVRHPLGMRAPYVGTHPHLGRHCTENALLRILAPEPLARVREFEHALVESTL